MVIYLNRSSLFTVLTADLALLCTNLLSLKPLTRDYILEATNWHPNLVSQQQTRNMPSTKVSQGTNPEKLNDFHRDHVNRLESRRSGGCVVGYIQNLVPRYREKLYQICYELRKDGFRKLPRAFSYPLNGLYEVCRDRTYWKFIGLYTGCYLGIFCIVATLLYIFILPFLLPWSVLFLGPVGIVLMHIQWFIQSNSITNAICSRLLMQNFYDQIFRTTLYLKAKSQLLKIADANTKRKPSWFNVTDLLQLTGAILRGIGRSLFISVLSLLPIFGPLVINQLTSVNRSLGYLRFYFSKLRNYSPADIKKFKYTHMVPLLGFGMASGLLEFLPLVSIITVTSNSVGAALWSIDLLEKENDTCKTGVNKDE